MNELVVIERATHWHRLRALVLDSVSSPITRRVYNLGLDEFIAWFTLEPRPAGFTKATVTAWRVALEARGLGPISINVRITAVRKLAVEAADNGLLAPELASGIARIKGVRSHGVRVGNWLSLLQAQTLISTPDIRTKERTARQGNVRYAAWLRIAPVGVGQPDYETRPDARQPLVHSGPGGQAWARADRPDANVEQECNRCVDSGRGRDKGSSVPPNRGDQVFGERLSEKVVWQMLKSYVVAACLPDIAPHDLGRTTAKLCRAAGGELEQIQMLLGHSSVQTTERYLGTKQDLAHAPNDGIKLKLAV